jgi:two-component system, NarL family, nitrate/nitrite response regulator NarL
MYDNAEYVSSSLRAGASGYVLKDAPASEVLRAIETVAAGGSYFCQQVISAIAQPQPQETPLTEREREILVRVVRGESNKRIAQELAISVRTVETHRMSLRRKLGGITSTGLVHYAIKQGWVDPASIHINN